MCKLCNTDRKPLVETKYRFLEEVNDYLGENPCSVCLLTINKTYNRHPNMPIDYVILRKLYLINRAFTGTKLTAAKQNIYRSKQKVEYILGIKVLTTSKSTTYYPHINNSNTGINICLPVCSTLQEAVQSKYDYMEANGHTRGLTQLKNKLKELSNDNN